MSTKSQKFSFHHFTLISTLFISNVLLVGVTNAANGYVTDSSGEIVRDRAGNCWHGSDWTEADRTVVGCDGVKAGKDLKVIKGEGSGAIAEIAIPAGAVFDFNSAELKDESKEVIDEYRKQLGPELTDAYMVLVVGHTDSSGDAKYNETMSKKRAQSVADYLVESGVNKDAIRVIGRGSAEPLFDNKTLDGRKQNRRVDIFAVAEVRALDTIVFPSAVLFERRSSELSPDGKAALEKNRAESADLLSRASFIEIIGHTDNVGGVDYNQKLSEQRAESVRDYLVSKGLDRNKISTLGLGESQPIANNNTDEGRAENRRVELQVLGRLNK